MTTTNSWMIPDGMWLFWTDSKAWYSGAIRRITRSQWSHMGVGFNLANGWSCYYEALVSHDVSGPRDAGDLQRWVKKARGRKVEIVPLAWVEPDMAAAALAECVRLQGRSGYSIRQLLWMWTHQRFGISVPASEHRLVCSEYASRVCYVAGVDLRDRMHRKHDEVTPGSARARAALLSQLNG